MSRELGSGKDTMCIFWRRPFWLCFLILLTFGNTACCSSGCPLLRLGCSVSTSQPGSKYFGVKSSLLSLQWSQFCSSSDVVLFIADIGTDLVNGIRLYTHKHHIWGGLTVELLLSSLFLFPCKLTVCTWIISAWSLFCPSRLCWSLVLVLGPRQEPTLGYFPFWLM